MHNSPATLILVNASKLSPMTAALKNSRLTAWLSAIMLIAVCRAAPARGQSGDVYSAEERAHWSLQSRTQPAVPTFADHKAAEWIRNPADAFVLKRLLD